VALTYRNEVDEEEGCHHTHVVVPENRRPIELQGMLDEMISRMGTRSTYERTVAGNKLEQGCKFRDDKHGGAGDVQRRRVLRKLHVDERVRGRPRTRNDPHGRDQRHAHRVDERDSAALVVVSAVLEEVEGE
jgi:hypothetical protein